MLVKDDQSWISASWALAVMAGGRTMARGGTRIRRMRSTEIDAMIRGRRG